MTEHSRGYRQAIEDMKELLNNALANGETTHIYEDLVDQLNLLLDEYVHENR